MQETSELAKLFGQRVRELRRDRGMSRERLAASIGVGKTALARIERGERFNAANIAPLAAALGVAVRDLFDFGHSPDARVRSIISLLSLADSNQLIVAERILRALLQP